VKTTTRLIKFSCPKIKLSFVFHLKPIPLPSSLACRVFNNNSGQRQAKAPGSVVLSVDSYLGYINSSLDSAAAKFLGVPLCSRLGIGDETSDWGEIKTVVKRGNGYMGPHFSRFFFWWFFRAVTRKWFGSEWYSCVARGNSSAICLPWVSLLWTNTNTNPLKPTWSPPTHWGQSNLPLHLAILVKIYVCLALHRRRHLNVWVQLATPKK